MAVNLAPGIFGAGGQFFSPSGIMLSGGFINTYLAGTTTPQPTFTTSLGTVQNSNPIVLNADGRPPQEIWLTAGIAYKFTLTDSLGVLIQTYDNLVGINDVTVPSASEWTTINLTPTFVNTTSFTLVGDQTSIFRTGRRIQLTETAGVVYGVVTSSSVSLSVTTVNVSLDSGAVVDSGLSIVAYGILNSQNVSIPQYFLGEVLYTNGIPTAFPSQVRQTVLNGPVDSSGFSAFGGSTGSTTVTAAGSLYIHAAGAATDRIGFITNPSWTGLSTNGTMYLFVDVAANGVCTTGSGTLVPVYQWGGTYSTTANQFTFNIQEMTAKVGTGAVANQAYRVYVGEVTVAGGVVTAITWYQLQGRYQVAQAVIAASTVYSFASNMGVSVLRQQLWLVCKTAESGYSIGDRLATNYMFDVTGRNFVLACTRNNATAVSSGGLETVNKSTGAVVSLTFANWSLEIDIDRGW